MKVQCGHCPAKYAVADERIRDKKVRIRCRRCNAAIVVDGKVSPPLVTSTPARPSAGPGSHAPGLESLPPSTPPADHPRPVAHTIMGGLEAPATQQLMQDHVGFNASARLEEKSAAEELDEDESLDEERAGRPDSSRGFTDPPARGAADRWRVALTQQDLRWMTTEEITQAFKDGAVKSETFVFRAGMPTWVTLLEVTEIAQALADAHLVSPPLQTLKFDGADALAAGSPRRNSSLPPPRKVARPRADSPLAELVSMAADGVAEPEESMPFALVAERAGSKRPDVEAGEVTTLEAAPPVGPAADTTSSALSSEVQGAGAPAPAAAAVPAPAAPDPVPPAPAVLSPLDAVAAASPARKSGGDTWIWISLLVLLVLAGAVFVLGPRFGLKLR